MVSDVFSHVYTICVGVKHGFRVSCSDLSVSSHTHTLQANGDYDKKAWLDAFRAVVDVSAVI